VSGSAGAVRAAVVGGGLGGTMMALYLARRGYRVDLYERRPDLRAHDVPGPSMNLGLSRRGLEALDRVGLAEAVLARAIPMSGRVIHDLDGGLAYQPYGRNGSQGINAVKRNDINAVLLDAAEAAGARLCFEQRCVRLDRESGEAVVRHGATGEETTVSADFWVGADGVFSSVRQTLQRGLRADYRQEYLDWGWKELVIPAGPGGSFPLEKHAFHLWPRGGCLLFAHPNPNGSFTCSFVLPFSGAESFDTLDEPGRIQEYFERSFPDVARLVPDLCEQFLRNPIVPLVSVRTSPWSYRDRVVLLGDSAHAVVPFYAQGMNAAFEDCVVLDACLDRFPGDRAAAFAAYEAERRPNTDALADMSKANFLELRDKVRSPWLRVRRKLDGVLAGLLGDEWAPLHAKVTNTTMPYAEALELTRRQDRILAGVGIALGGASVLAVLAAVFRRPRN
jgi:kynurenine 3-monooxygenase